MPCSEESKVMNCVFFGNGNGGVVGWRGSWERGGRKDVMEGREGRRDGGEGGREGEGRM